LSRGSRAPRSSASCLAASTPTDADSKKEIQHPSQPQAYTRPHAEGFRFPGDATVFDVRYTYQKQTSDRLAQSISANNLRSCKLARFSGEVPGCPGVR